jgi:hypothetical protein
VNGEFEFLKSLAKTNPAAMDADLVSEIDEYTKAWAKHGTLIPRSAVPKFLGVSRQRFYKYQEKYSFWNEEFLGVTYYSYIELKEFRKVKKPTGAHNPGWALQPA